MIHLHIVYSVILDPTRAQVYSGSMDGNVIIWNLQNGQQQHTLTGHTSLVGLLSLSPSYLVSAAADATLRVWDPDTGKLLNTLDTHEGAVTCVHHDDFKVLSGSEGMLKIWDIRDGRDVRDLLTGIAGVWQVVFEGQWCVAAINKGGKTYLDVWNFESSELPRGIFDEASGDNED